LPLKRRKELRTLLRAFKPLLLSWRLSEVAEENQGAAK